MALAGSAAASVVAAVAAAVAAAPHEIAAAEAAASLVCLLAGIGYLDGRQELAAAAAHPDVHGCRELAESNTLVQN